MSVYDNRLPAPPYRYDPKVRNLQKCPNYRNNLETLIGATIQIQCDLAQIQLYHKRDTLLLENAEITHVPFGLNMPSDTSLGRITVNVDTNWKIRTHAKPGKQLQITGFVYEYQKNGRRQLGFSAQSLRPMSAGT